MPNFEIQVENFMPPERRISDLDEDQEIAEFISNHALLQAATFMLVQVNDMNHVPWSFPS